MKKMMVFAALVAVVGLGCKSKKKEEGTGGPPVQGSAEQPGSAAAGSAAGSGGAMAGSGAGSAVAAKPLTPDDEAKRYQECLGFFNAGKFDDFKGCFTADAVFEMVGSPMPPANGPDAIATVAKGFKDAFPDGKADPVLILVNDQAVATVMLFSGTNSAPFKTPMGEMPPTNKKIGLLTSQLFKMDGLGHAQHQWDFFDMATMMGQMNPNPKMPTRPVMDKAPALEVVIAKNDDKEKKNLETFKAAGEAFSKHDAKAFGALLADDVVWFEAHNPKDTNKKETLDGAQKFWKAFSDAKLNPTTAWCAGDYCVGVATLEATNDGDMPEMHLKKTGKKVTLTSMMVQKIADGKIKNAWLFDNSMAMAMQLGLMPPPGAPPAGAGSAAPKGEAPKDDKKAPDKKAPEKKG